MTQQFTISVSRPDGTPISVVVTKKRVKNFNLRVTSSGEVHASAPLGASRERIEAFVQRNSSWIINRLAKCEQHQATAREPLSTSSVIALWGKPITVQDALDHNFESPPPRPKQATFASFMGADEPSGRAQAKQRTALDGLTPKDLQTRIDQLYASEVTAAAFATIAMSTLPGWAVGIIIAAALSAIFSTADSCLSAAASHFMTDLYLPYIGKNVDTKDRRLVTISRAFTVIAGLAAVGVSMLLPTILDGCFYAYYIYTSGVFCPIVFGVFWKKATKQGAIAGLLAGGLFMMYALLTGFSVAGIGGELLSGIVSAIALVVVSLATQPKKTAA